MSDESKKIEKIEQEAKESELSEKDLDNVAGGGGGPLPIAGGGAVLIVPPHKGGPPPTPGARPEALTGFKLA